MHLVSRRRPSGDGSRRRRGARSRRASRSGPRSAASTTARAWPQLFEAAGLRIEAWRSDPRLAVRAGRGGAGMSTLAARGARGRPRGARLRGAAQRVAHAAAARRGGRVHPGRGGHRAAMSAGDGRSLPGTLPFLRRYGARQGWTETCTAKGTPCFELPAGGTLTFEPGGQLEYSSPPCRSPERAAGAAAVGRPAAPRGGGGRRDRLCWRWASIRSTPPNGRRCCCTTKRYAADGGVPRPAWGRPGARMMRQTAAFQVSARPRRRALAPLAVLNAAAPYVVAIFANSPVYDGVGDRLPEHPGAGVARAGSGADRPALGRAGAGRRVSRVRARRAGDPAAGRGRRAPAVRRVARPRRADAGGVARPPEHAVSRGAAAGALRAPVGGRDRAASGTRRRSRWRSGITYDPGPSAPPPTCSAAPTSACSIAPAGWVCATPPWRAPRPTGARSRSQGARALGPGYFHPSDLEQARRSSIATLGGGGLRRTTLSGLISLRRSLVCRRFTTEARRTRRTTEPATRAPTDSPRRHEGHEEHEGEPGGMSGNGVHNNFFVVFFSLCPPCPPCLCGESSKMLASTTSPSSVER